MMGRNLQRMRTTQWPESREQMFAEFARLRGEHLIAAWAAWLGGLPWEWFVTLTFDPGRRYPVSAQLAGREAVTWCGHVGCALRVPVAWLIALERGRSGQWHAHALIAGTQRDLSSATPLWEARNGGVDVRPVHNAHGVVLYSTKEAALSGELILSDTLWRYRTESPVRRRVNLCPDLP